MRNKEPTSSRVTLVFNGWVGLECFCLLMQHRLRYGSTMRLHGDNRFAKSSLAHLYSEDGGAPLGKTGLAEAFAVSMTSHHMGH